MDRCCEERNTEINPQLHPLSFVCKEIGERENVRQRVESLKALVDRNKGWYWAYYRDILHSLFADLQQSQTKDFDEGFKFRWGRIQRKGENEGFERVWLHKWHIYWTEQKKKVRTLKSSKFQQNFISRVVAIAQFQSSILIPPKCHNIQNQFRHHSNIQ